MKSKEAEIADHGGFEKFSMARTAGVTLGDAIDKHLKSTDRNMGRTKAPVLSVLRGLDIANSPCPTITSQRLVQLAEELRDGGRQPQTVSNYFSHLSAIFAIAGPAWDLPLDLHELRSVSAVCKKLGLIGRSKKESAALQSKR